MIRDNVARYADHGWLLPEEARMLVSLDGRRAATRDAKAAGSRTARTMHRFQRTAVRLAHLRQRMIEGTAPWDAPQREQHLLADLATARAELGRSATGGPGAPGVPA